MQNFNTPHSERYRLRRGKLKCIDESSNTINKLELMDYVEPNPTACEQIFFLKHWRLFTKTDYILNYRKSL